MVSITKTQLENASLDAISLDTFANGANTVTVTSRLGTTYPTVSKFLLDNQTAITNAQAATLAVSLATTNDAVKASGQIGYNSTLNYVAGTLGFKANQFKTFEDFGAVGDGTADDSTAIENALASNTDVYGRPGSTYRITRQIDIPTACTSRFIGNGNFPLQSCKFFIDFSGIAFKGAAGTTSFYCFEGFHCYSSPSHANAQFIAHDGDTVHAELTRLSFLNFKKIPLDLNSAFRCNIEFLGQYCWDYMCRVNSGSASRIKFSADHSYGGGITLGANTGGFIIEPYTEMICSDNNPAGANASHREMLISGANHKILGGILSVHTLNNKIPIELNVARAISFDCVSGFSLGAAAYWINLNATDSSCVITNSPLLTLGGAGVARSIAIDPGYSTTQADITIGGVSVRSTICRAWVVFDGSGGVGPASIRQATSIATVTKTATGSYTVTIPTGLFANASYSVNIGVACVAVVACARYVYSTKSATTLEIRVNNTASTATVDADEVSVELTGP